MTEVVDVRTRRRDATRRDILDAAWLLAEEQGIASLSLRELATRVGMRAPSLYTYFASKAAIFDAMFAQGYGELDQLYEAVAIDPADALGSLAQATEQFVQFCQTSVPRYQLMFTRVVPDWSPSPEAYAASVASFARMVERLEPLGISGDRDMDLWTAMTGGLAAQQLANDPAGDRWRRLSRDMAEMFLDHLRRQR